MALGFHVGLKSKLPHVHIEVEYKVARAMPKFNKRIHWEKRRGTLKQALDYLNKEDKLEERGDRPRLDAKITTTTAEHYEDACQGIVHPESAIYIKYRNYFDSVAAAHAPDKTYNGELHCKNIWIWGTTGMGKSAFVRDAAKEEGVAVYPKLRDKWWDGYEGQKYVLMDELMKRPPWELLELIKQWGDRFSFLAQYKGGARVCYPSDFRMCITSNHPPEYYYRNIEDYNAVIRRYEVWHMTEPYIPIAKRTLQVAAPPRPANPTPPCSQTYESQTEEAENISSSWN